MGIPMNGKDGLYIEMGPKCQVVQAAHRIVFNVQ